MTGKRDFVVEIKRRNVPRAAVLYVGTAWALTQGVAQLAPVVGVPDWVPRWFLVACAIGFPFWVAFAWFYELTPQGFKRESAVVVSTPQRHSNARKLDFAIIAVMAVAIVLLASGYVVQRKPVPAGDVAKAVAIPAQSVAVLPFANLSSDKDNAYFVDGMQDLILTKLADIGSLKVIARTSTAKYASHPDDLATIGQQLGVATLLEGSVQKAGNAVLINVQLVKAADGAHIWAQSYQRTLDNVFGVEGEVAEKIAAALDAQLSPQTTAQLATALSNNPTANDLYLQADYFTRRGDVDYDTVKLKQAVPMYQQAIAAAPDFALARARLSYTESELAWFGGAGEDVTQLQADARAQATQALQLAPNLPEAQLALGYCDYWGKGDYAGALAAFAAALKLRPNDAGALAAQAYVYRRQGDFAAAIKAFRQSVDRDPRDTDLTFELGSTYQLASRYGEAATVLRHALALDPSNVRAKLVLSQTILLADGDAAAALAAAPGDAPELLQHRVNQLTFARQYRQALAVLDSIPDTPDNFNSVTASKTLQQADLYRQLGDSAKARALFSKALPQTRAQMNAAGGVPIRQAMVWNIIGIAELGVGHVDKALDAIAKSQVLVDRAHDQVYGPTLMEANATLYAQAQRADLAVPLMARALAEPGIAGTYSPVMLWLDPGWDPIRDTPQFQALLKKYAKDKPAAMPVASTRAASS